jgi:hypothetical protein
MIASSWWKVGLGLLGVTGVLASSGAGCGSSTTSSSSTEGTTAATTGSGGGSGGTGGASGTGGDVTTTSATTTTTTGATTTTTTTTTTGSTTSSTGTSMAKYPTCGDCTNLDTGAPSAECNEKHDACFANKNCVQLYDCAYFNPGCNTDASGACCTYDCYDALKKTLNDAAAAQTAIDLYHAYDSCLYCTTCLTQCDAQEYCTAYAAYPAGCVN